MQAVKTDNAVLVDIVNKLDKCFNVEELRDIAFELNVDYESLGGQGKRANARRLVQFLDNKSRIPELINICAKKCPSINWQGQSMISEEESSPTQPTRVSASVNISDCPFVAGPKIMDPRIFVGRRQELRMMRQMMTGLQPMSLNIHGERRIGKSSLLYHFYQTCIEDPSKYAVRYISLQNTSCTTQVGFYKNAAQSLLEHSRVKSDSELDKAFRAVIDDLSFETALKACRQRNILPVLCLDEFEALISRTKEFSNDFYNHLRALIDDNLLMLILASKENVRPLAQKFSLTSLFFNNGQFHELKDLTPNEADELVRLPVNGQSSNDHALPHDLQTLAREWGRENPWKLQLACYWLWQAKHSGASIEWAKKQFEQQKPPPDPALRFNWKKPLDFVFIGIPSLAGRFAKHMGESWDSLTNWLIGIVIFVIVILAAIGLLTHTQVEEIIKRFLGVGP